MMSIMWEAVVAGPGIWKSRSVTPRVPLVQRLHVDLLRVASSAQAPSR